MMSASCASDNGMTCTLGEICYFHEVSHAFASPFARVRERSAGDGATIS